MNRLGRNQKIVLDCLKKRGSWSPSSWWFQRNHSHMVRICESLVKRGLVDKVEGTKVYVIKKAQ